MFGNMFNDDSIESVETSLERDSPVHTTIAESSGLEEVRPHSSIVSRDRHNTVIVGGDLTITFEYHLEGPSNYSV
jgi:hypothetical protein